MQMRNRDLFITCFYRCFAKPVALGMALGILGQAVLPIALRKVKPVVERTNAFAEETKVDDEKEWRVLKVKLEGEIRTTLDSWDGLSTETKIALRKKIIERYIDLLAFTLQGVNKETRTRILSGKEQYLLTLEGFLGSIGVTLDEDARANYEEFKELMAKGGATEASDCLDMVKDYLLGQLARTMRPKAIMGPDNVLVQLPQTNGLIEKGTFEKAARLYLIARGWLEYTENRVQEKVQANQGMVKASLGKFYALWVKRDELKREGKYWEAEALDGQLLNEAKRIKGALHGLVSAFKLHIWNEDDAWVLNLANKFAGYLAVAEGKVKQRFANEVIKAYSVTPSEGEKGRYPENYFGKFDWRYDKTTEPITSLRQLRELPGDVEAFVKKFDEKLLADIGVSKEELREALMNALFNPTYPKVGTEIAFVVKPDPTGDVLKGAFRDAEFRKALDWLLEPPEYAKDRSIAPDVYGSRGDQSYKELDFYDLVLKNSGTPNSSDKAVAIAYMYLAMRSVAGKHIQAKEESAEYYANKVKGVPPGVLTANEEKKVLKLLETARRADISVIESLEAYSKATFAENPMQAYKAVAFGQVVIVSREHFDLLKENQYIMAQLESDLAKNPITFKRDGKTVTIRNGEDLAEYFKGEKNESLPVEIRFLARFNYAESTVGAAYNYTRKLHDFAYNRFLQLIGSVTREEAFAEADELLKDPAKLKAYLDGFVTERPKVKLGELPFYRNDLRVFYKAYAEEYYFKNDHETWMEGEKYRVILSKPLSDITKEDREVLIGLFNNELGDGQKEFVLAAVLGEEMILANFFTGSFAKAETAQIDDKYFIVAKNPMLLNFASESDKRAYKEYREQYLMAKNDTGRKDITERMEKLLAKVAANAYQKDPEGVLVAVRTYYQFEGLPREVEQLPDVFSGIQNLDDTIILLKKKLRKKIEYLEEFLEPIEEKNESERTATEQQLINELWGTDLEKRLIQIYEQEYASWEKKLGEKRDALLDMAKGKLMLAALGIAPDNKVAVVELGDLTTEAEYLKGLFLSNIVGVEMFFDSVLLEMGFEAENTNALFKEDGQPRLNPANPASVQVALQSSKLPSPASVLATETSVGATIYENGVLTITGRVSLDPELYRTEDLPGLETSFKEREKWLTLYFMGVSPKGEGWVPRGILDQDGENWVLIPMRYNKKTGKTVWLDEKKMVLPADAIAVQWEGGKFSISINEKALGKQTEAVKKIIFYSGTAVDVLVQPNVEGAKSFAEGKIGKIPGLPPFPATLTLPNIVIGGEKPKIVAADLGAVALVFEETSSYFKNPELLDEHLSQNKFDKVFSSIKKEDLSKALKGITRDDFLEVVADAENDTVKVFSGWEKYLDKNSSIYKNLKLRLSGGHRKAFTWKTVQVSRVVVCHAKDVEINAVLEGEKSFKVYQVYVFNDQTRTYTATEAVCGESTTTLKMAKKFGLDVSAVKEVGVFDLNWNGSEYALWYKAMNGDKDALAVLDKAGVEMKKGNLAYIEFVFESPKKGFQFGTYAYEDGRVLYHLGYRLDENTIMDLMLTLPYEVVKAKEGGWKVKIEWKEDSVGLIFQKEVNLLSTITESLIFDPIVIEMIEYLKNR